MKRKTFKKLIMGILSMTVILAGTTVPVLGAKEDIIVKHAFENQMSSNNQTEDVEVFFETYYEDNKEYAHIRALSENETLLWEKNIGGNIAAQCTANQPIGRTNTSYYYKEMDMLYKVDLFTGEEDWKCPCDGSISTDAVTMGPDGTLYLSGYLQPDLTVIDADGRLLKRINSFQGCEYYWPYKLELSDNTLSISFEGAPDGQEHTIFVNIDDYSFYE